jgi:hypothetical protein
LLRPNRRRTSSIAIRSLLSAVTKRKTDFVPRFERRFSSGPVPVPVVA